MLLTRWRVYSFLVVVVEVQFEGPRAIHRFQVINPAV